MGFSDVSELRLATAFAVGLLVGAERERRRAEQSSGGFAGLRTFGLVGFLGGLLSLLESPSLIVAGALLVGSAALVAYVVNRDREEDRGVTTEIALVVTYGLGVLAMTSPLSAAGWAVIVASVLALRGWLHKLVRESLTEDELRDALVFLLVALVVVPAAPDVSMGPYGAINPRSLAVLVCVLMGITGSGYVAQRLLGPRYGLALTGFAAGFVSSSATIASLGARAREEPHAWRSATAGALASSVATVVQYALILAAVDLSLLLELAWPLGLAGLASLLGAGVFTRLAVDRETIQARPGRAFYPLAALGFAAVVALVAIASSALKSWFGGTGIVVASGLAALVDAHSTSGSIASLHKAGHVDSSTACIAILTALSTNSLTKIAMALSGRNLKYSTSVIVGVLAIAGAAWIGLWVHGF